jgi:CHAD domain-containing protein
MPFHFKKTEPAARAVRRVCREHLGEAQARLRQSRHPASVHGVRKEIKKLRAIFRLVRAETARGAYRRAAKGLRRAARRLAATRDARVRFQAFAQLAGRHAAERFPVLHQALFKDCRRESRRFRDDDSVALAKRVLRKTGRRVAGLKFTASGWAAIAPGLMRSYRRGQQAGRRARREPSPENLHEWRKQVKTFWHQLRLVCPKWPAAVRKFTDQLEQLAQLLGDEHDLDLLQEFVTEHAPVAEAAMLDPLIAARQKKLRNAALKLGARLYAKDSAAVGQQLGRDWNAWHGRDRKR